MNLYFPSDNRGRIFWGVQVRYCFYHNELTKVLIPYGMILCSDFCKKVLNCNQNCKSMKAFREMPELLKTRVGYFIEGVDYGKHYLPLYEE